MLCRPDRRRACRQLVHDGALSHDFEYVKRRFAQEGICWRGFGEIIAYNSSGDYERFGQQWFNSQVHHDIMLGELHPRRWQPGGRWRRPVLRGDDLREALRGGVDTLRLHRHRGSAFVSDIRWLVDEQITAGCAPGRYCPRAP